MLLQLRQNAVCRTEYARVSTATVTLLRFEVSQIEGLMSCVTSGLFFVANGLAETSDTGAEGSTPALGAGGSRFDSGVSDFRVITDSNW